MAQAGRKRLVGESSREKNLEEMWQRMQGLVVLGVAKHFLWKVRNDILPTKSNLFSKKIMDHPICPVCQCEEETIIHFLGKCLVASGV